MKKSKTDMKVRFSLRWKLSLTMIFVTIAVIVTMAFYTINRESRILLEDNISLAERELDHVVSVTKEAVSTEDELSLFAAVENSRKLKSLQYLYIYDSAGMYIQSTDTANLGKKADDVFSKESIAMDKSESYILRRKLKDDKDPKGSIYDFSKPVFDKITGKNRIATVRIGITDQKIRNEINSMKKLLVFISIGFILVTIIIALFLSMIITKPLKILSKGVQIIGTGSLGHKITVSSGDEVGMLAHQFNIMTNKLKEAQEKEIENRIMQEQLEVAQEIQEGLNPIAFYQKDGIQIKGYTRAAKGVGGDYFDYHEIGADRIGALISDVSGKGIPASLVMVMIRTVFIASLHQDEKKLQCSKVVSAINGSLSADFAIDKFATLFFFIYDKKKETISFTNAGHGPLFLYRSKSNSCTITKLDGMPIGIMEDTEYVQAETSFGPGDIVILNTDGITEMRNNKKEEYGRTRLQKFIVEHNKLNAEEIVRKLVVDVDSFKGSAAQHDDMTLLIFKREK